MFSSTSIEPWRPWMPRTSSGIASRSDRSAATRSITAVPPSQAAAVSSSAVPLRATSTRFAIDGSRLSRTAVARPMPWLAPVTTAVRPVLTRPSRAAAEEVRVQRLGHDDVGGDRDLHVPLVARQDPHPLAGVVDEQARVL